MGGLGICLLFPQYRTPHIEVLQGTWNYSFARLGKLIRFKCSEIDALIIRNDERADWLRGLENKMFLQPCTQHRREMRDYRKGILSDTQRKTFSYCKTNGGKALPLQTHRFPDDRGQGIATLPRRRQDTHRRTRHRGSAGSRLPTRILNTEPNITQKRPQ